MKRGLILLAALSFVITSCSSGKAADSGIASLSDNASITTTTAGDSNADAEQAMLDFAQCVRDNGLPDFPDPVVGSDGSLSFGFRGQGAADAGIDPRSDEFRTAMSACSDKLQGIALGGSRGQFDPTELQDQLLQVAQCLRDKGYDVTDPQLDFTGGGPAGGERGPTAGSDGQSGPPADGGRFQIFGPNFDVMDANNQAALQDCAESVGMTGFGLRIGGGPGGAPPNGGTPPGDTTGTTSAGG
jgi:hypothetical protein